MNHNEFQSDSLQATAYEYLYNKIVNGVIPPGERVVEQKIVEETGISRSPIREAIRQLASEGLLTVLPRGGVRVYRATSADFKSLFECRLSLEPTAAYYAALRITDLQMFQFEQLMNEMKQVVEMKDIDQLKILSERFHNMIIESSDNPFLAKIMRQLFTLITFYRNAIVNIPQRVERGLEEHEEIWNAIKNRDAKAAEKLMRDHLTLDYEFYISQDHQ
ncbi:GntR family transcriptional regulator [Priestia filamentosa]|uniref:GntR family transcriptional regulator n=1 Tax=Priestia filamentosa TaxID=1402861 RepID=UPI001FB21EA4|nr:GntR family transcriptional regulator [Priestia filamentosa]MED3728752.1 GntR family transcriptional regulator [Priestia filamentosa]UOE58541.1 GntR family transcriptional regulator [Priestia filamentosa]